MAWNRPSESRQAQERVNRTVHGKAVVLYSAVAILLVAGGLATWRFLAVSSSTEEWPEVTVSSGLIEEVRPATSRKSAEPSTNVQRRVISPEEQARLRPSDPGFNPAAHPTVLVMTNRYDEVADRHPVARNGTEQILNWIFSTPPGALPSLCPNIPISEAAQIEKILDLPADYQFDESLDRLEAKRTIEAARKELKDYISKGGTPDKFFEYYHNQLIQCHQEYTDAQNSVLKMAREENDTQLVRDYLEAVNQRLSDKGICNIRLSRKMRERLGITESQKEENTK